MSKKRRRQSNPSRPDAVYMVTTTTNNYAPGGGRYVSPAQGRFYCAKWLEETRHTRDQAHLIDVLCERVDTLLDALYDLKDAVLYKGGSPAAFKLAKNIDDLIRSYLEGRRE